MALRGFAWRVCGGVEVKISASSSKSVLLTIMSACYSLRYTMDRRVGQIGWTDGFDKVGV